MRRYKRALFSDSTTPAQLKEELRRLAQGVKEAVELSLGPHDAPAPLQNGTAAAAAGGELVRAALLEQDQATAAADTLASAEFDADAARGGAVLTYEKLRAMLDSLTLLAAGGLLAAPAPDAGLVMSSRGGGACGGGGGSSLIESRNGNGNANSNLLTRANSLAGRAPANGARHQRIELKAPPKARPKHNRDLAEPSSWKPRDY